MFDTALTSSIADSFGIASDMAGISEGGLATRRRVEYESVQRNVRLIV